MAVLASVSVPAILLVCLLYLISRSIWFLYFSPLSHFPGPRLAAISYVYEFYFDAWQPGNYVWQIGKLHKRFGELAAAQERPTFSALHLIITVSLRSYSAD